MKTHKMKIMILCSSYYPHVKGGGELSTQLLAEGLAKKGIDVVVVATSSKASEELINNVKVYRIKSPNVYWSYEKSSQSLIKKICWFLLNSYNPRIKKRLLPLLSKEQPDIVHTSTLEDISAYAWKVAKKAGYPVVHTLRSYTLLCPKGDMFKRGKNCRKQCFSCKIVSYPQKPLTRYVDAVVGNSRFTLNQHLKYQYFAGAKQQVIFNIFENKEKIVAKKDKDFIFGYIGRLHTTKGLDLLLDAFIKAQLPAHVSLLIAGKGDASYIDTLKEKAAGSPVTFAGYMQARDFYTRVDAVIMPSVWHEPLARVLYEAFSFGKPVIGSNTGGTGEILEDQKTGFLFDPAETAQLEEKIIALYMMYAEARPEYQAMQQNCREKSKLFWERTVLAQYIAIYNDLLQK